MKTSLGLMIGFVIGSVVGFAWSQNTKSRLGENTTTEMKGGKLIITMDAGKAATQGAQDAFDRIFN